MHKLNPNAKPFNPNDLQPSQLNQLNAITQDQVTSYGISITKNLSIIFSTPNVKYTNVYQKMNSSQIAILTSIQYTNINTYLTDVQKGWNHN
jgi:penicillin-binding protein-related factor A (putative recombinase)